MMDEPGDGEFGEMEDALDEAITDAALRAQLTAMTERDRVRHEDYQRACGMIAAMHRAAMGVTCGPSRGVVEDVEDLRTAFTAGQQEVARLRMFVGKVMESRRSYWRHMNEMYGDPTNDATLTRELRQYDPLYNDAEQALAGTKEGA